jgi:type IV pilus biogenesis/stability protein PilW
MIGREPGGRNIDCYENLTIRNHEQSRRTPAMRFGKFLGLLSFWLVLWGCVPIASGPNDTQKEIAKTYYQMSVDFLKDGKTPQAIQYILKAIAINPRNADFQHALGLAYQQKGLYDKAIDQYKKALELNPKLTEARNNWGTVLLVTGKDDAAIKLFQECLKDQLYATPDKAAYNIGVAYFHKKDLDKAMEYYRKSISLRHDNAVAMYNLAFCLQKKNDNLKAAQWYKRAVTTDPSYKDAHYALGMLLMGDQDIQGALEQFKKAVDLAPKDMQAVLQLGIAQIRLGQEDEGRKNLQKVILDNPESGLSKIAQKETDLLKPKRAPKPVAKHGHR